MKDFLAFDEIYPCECGTEYLRITRFKDESQFSFSKYCTYTSNPNLLQRIKLAINYILNPKKFDIHSDVIFSEDTTIKFIRDLDIHIYGEY